MTIPPDWPFYVTAGLVVVGLGVMTIAAVVVGSRSEGRLPDSHTLDCTPWNCDISGNDYATRKATCPACEAGDHVSCYAYPDGGDCGCTQATDGACGPTANATYGWRRTEGPGQ